MTVADKPAYEKLGAFYLGRRVEPQSQEVLPEDLLYDAKDLTTHALCVGMTGSGKTGLCISLLEEALIDGVPVIAIDPKGDLSNLALTFPQLRAEDFRPYVDEGEALRKGVSADQLAQRTAENWRDGLAQWNQTPDRIARLQAAASVQVYTPGSESVRPLSVLRSLSAPPGSEANREALTDHIAATVASLLALSGVEGDPLTSREHVLLSQILEQAFSAGESLDLGKLVLAIQKPPFDRIGVLDLEAFYPAAERRALALRLNSLLASPSFAAWLAGEPLHIDRLLRAPDGKPQLSVLSIAHLSDRERMFFVTLLLSEVVSWMRTQSGTTSLRAILYMDEVFGFLPPVQAPPSKQPMLTLLKQARAFGLGVVLATQNPVDVDYKALSNCGTWFLGRLQTARDKDRVLDGLEGAAQAAGSSFDRATCDTLLSGLGSRRFLMNNVHDDAPVLFHTRWALSYLRGPLTLQQLAALKAAQPPQGSAAVAAASASGAASHGGEPVTPPAPPGDLPVRFAATLPGEGELRYQPVLYAHAQLHYVDGRRGVDLFRDVVALGLLSEDQQRVQWDVGELFDLGAFDLADRPEQPATFAQLANAPLRDKALKRAADDLGDALYRERPLLLLRCEAFKLVADVDETPASFEARVAQAAREARDLQVEKLRDKYAPKLARLQDRIGRAEQKVSKEEAQVSAQSLNTAVSVGTTLLGALFGRRTLSGAKSAVRSASRVSKEKDDVKRAQAALDDLQADLEALEQEFEEQVKTLEDGAEVLPKVETAEVRARKGDLKVDQITLLWLPQRNTAQGPKPAWAQPVAQPFAPGAT